MSQVGSRVALGAGGSLPTTRISLDRHGGSTEGEQGPASTVTTTTGEDLRLPAGKPAVLSFATAWCGPVVETAALAAIAREFGPRVVVLGVGVDPSEPLADLDAFAARFGGGYGYVLDGDGTLSTALAVRTLDSTVVLDPGGRIVWRDVGPTDETTLRAGACPGGPGMTAAIAFAFGAGVLATVNPCGFAMLPAFLGYYLGHNRDSTASDLSGDRRVVTRIGQGFGVGSRSRSGSLRCSPGPFPIL